MNTIEKLIAELCPEGVEYFSVCDLCHISRGRVMSKQYLAENIGEYPVYSSQTVNKWMIGKITTYDYDWEYLTWTTDGANAWTIFYRENKFSITNVCGLLQLKENHNIKFIYYILWTVTKTYVSAGMWNPKLMSNVMWKIKIPIPPLKIQEEIVKILDSFTQLEAELETELEKRKKQYEYYRDELLSFEDEEVEWKTIKELFDFKNWLNKWKEFFGKWTPIVNFKDVFKNISLIWNDIKGKVEVTDKEKWLYGVKKNDLFFTRTSEIREEIWKVSTLLESIENCVFSGFILRARLKTSLLDSKFCSYFFSSYKARKEIVRYSTFTTRALTSWTRLAKIKVPLPPLEKQKEIVKILDKFDALVNDISEGLPAEIEARKKQYEYYREKLLTFKELEK